MAELASKGISVSPVKEFEADRDPPSHRQSVYAITNEVRESKKQFQWC